MKIDQNKLQQMFVLAYVNKDDLYKCLRNMGSQYLKKEYRHRWSVDNPTSCYCYVVSEYVYYYTASFGAVPYILKIPNDPAMHRFLIYPGNKIVDLTAEQFENYYEDVDYSKAKKSWFLQTGCKGPSKRAKILAYMMGNINGF